jgi:exonuclease VII large subunit
MKKTLENKSRELQHQKELLRRNSFEERLLFYKDEIKNITNSYQNFFLLSLNQKEGKLKQLLDAFSLNNPSKKDKTGYAQISKNGDIMALDELNIGDTFSSQNSKVEITSKVLQKRELQR